MSSSGFGGGVNGLTASCKRKTDPQHRVAGQDVGKEKMERVEDKVAVGRKGRMVMLEVTQKPQTQQQQPQQQQQQQKRHVPPSLQEQLPTPRVSIKLTSAARRNARTPAAVAKASATPVPAATILRGPLVAHRESGNGNGNGNNDDGSNKLNYRYLENSVRFFEDEIERLSSSPTGCPVKAAQEATQLAQKVMYAFDAAQRLGGVDEARVQQLSVKAMQAVAAASKMTAAATAVNYTATREDPRLHGKGSTAAGTAAGTSAPPTPYGGPQLRKWKRMPRHANASAAAPPVGTTQPGGGGTPTTAVTQVHKKRGIDAAGTMATAAKPTPDENEAAWGLAALAVPAPAARETQPMRSIAGPADTATVQVGFSHRKGDVSVGSPTVAGAVAGAVAIVATPWLSPPAPAALPVPPPAARAGGSSAMDEDQACKTTAAAALLAITATPWVMPPAPTALPVPAAVPTAVPTVSAVSATVEDGASSTESSVVAMPATPRALPPAPAALPVPASEPTAGGISAMDEENVCETTAAATLVAMPARPWGIPPAPAALTVPTAVPAVGGTSPMDEERSCKTSAASAAPIKTAATWSMGPLLAALAVPGDHAGEQDGATGKERSKKEEEELEEGETRVERKASVEALVNLTLTHGYEPAEASAAFAAAQEGAAAKAAAAKAAAAKAAAAKAAAVAVAPAAEEAAAKAKASSPATAPFLEPGALLASARASEEKLTHTTAVQQPVKPSPAVGKTVNVPPIVDSVRREAQDEANRFLAAGGIEHGGVGGKAEQNDTVSHPSSSPPAPSKIRQTAVAVAELLATKTEGDGLVETNSGLPDPTCAPKTATDPALETINGTVSFSPGAALDGKAPATAATSSSSRDTAQLLLLRDRAVVRERRRATLRMSSRSSLLTMASPARAAATRTRARARFSRQGRAARKALRRDDVMSRARAVLWSGDGSNNGGRTTAGKEGEGAKGDGDDVQVTNTSNGSVEASQTQSWCLSAEIVQRPQQQQQKLQQQQQERLSTLIGMHRIVSDIRTVRRAFKTDAFRLRVWRTTASRQSEVAGTGD